MRRRGLNLVASSRLRGGPSLSCSHLSDTCTRSYNIHGFRSHAYTVAAYSSRIDSMTGKHTVSRTRRRPMSTGSLPVSPNPAPAVTPTNIAAQDSGIKNVDSSPIVDSNSTSGSVVGDASGSSDNIAAHVPEQVLESVPQNVLEPLGNWPHDYVVTVIQSTHELGIPYWGAIIGLTVAVRFLMFPLTVFQAKVSDRMTRFQPAMQKVMDQRKEDPKSGEIYRMQMYKKAIHELYARHQVRAWHPLVMPLVQMPLFISFFVGVRKAGEYLPGFQEGGALWFMDLTQADPKNILPLCASLAFVSMGELGADGMSTTPKMRAFTRILSVLMLPMVVNMQVGLLIYLTTNGGIGALQALMLRNNKFRTLLNLPPPGTNSNKMIDNALKGSHLEKYVDAIGAPNPVQGVREYMQRESEATEGQKQKPVTLPLPNRQRILQPPPTNSATAILNASMGVHSAARREGKKAGVGVKRRKKI